MIYESSYWKQPLLRTAQNLKKHKSPDDFTEKDFAKLERELFIGFYSIRKIFEAPGKVTDETKNFRVEMSFHRNKKPVNALNNFKIDELYDLENSEQEDKDILFTCHRIIHSFVFLPYFDEVQFAGIYFSSDIDKDKKLYALSKDKIIEIFERVGNDYPQKIIWETDATTGKIKVTAI